MDKMIRFINSKYEDQFKLPDGGVVEVTFPDRQFSVKCEYVDNYHLRFGNETLHICQLAQMLERGNGSCKPEPIIPEEQAAWNVGDKGYLALQVSEEGYDYTLYDKEYNELDGGQIDGDAFTMNQVRDDILADAGLDQRIMTRVDYDTLMECVEEKEQEELSAARASVLEKLHTVESVSSGHLESKGKEEVR